MSFAYPIFLWLPLFLPLVLYLRNKRSTPPAAIPFPSYTILEKAGTGWRARLRTLVLRTLSLGLLAVLSLAAARPQEVRFEQQEEVHRNLMLALDVSASMRTADFFVGFRPSSRLQAVKDVVEQFIQARGDDRMGLVVFGTSAYLECPLTLDHEVLSEMVAGLQQGMAGDNTAIGDGLGLALKRVEEIPAKSSAIILLTDGVNTSGTVNPLQAAEIAHELGIKVHTIGIGTNNNQLRGLPFARGRRADYDEDLLKGIASKTGGVYFHAENYEGLQEVYKEIDRLEKSEHDTPPVRLVKEYYHHCLFLALVLFGLLQLLQTTLFLKVP